MGQLGRHLGGKVTMVTPEGELLRLMQLLWWILQGRPYLVS